MAQRAPAFVEMKLFTNVSSYVRALFFVLDGGKWKGSLVPGTDKSKTFPTIQTMRVCLTFKHGALSLDTMVNQNFRLTLNRGKARGSENMNGWAQVDVKSEA